MLVLIISAADVDLQCMRQVSVKRSFVPRGAAKMVGPADAVEYKLIGLQVHRLFPGKPPVVLSRQDFGEKLSDGTLQVV